ncbi:hypothetical protein FRACYDRAFT_261967 [Fragilariopsis cylindrus CCMP1102]|uniref:Uncharacterized protein n=1 Tax=Fragilariopsis cylindrus CCMP1102 TaxID=635003 RepID=A0A1E7F8G2_9STRA|nr:hypothetical protein FRACYDRAFT_261967 [Fragilariopsis cylindrus CCMP1102]|eukprot:OEU14429.1 hypothetical protein FRACYDRAFT_261967 [Fragilariopsis cylindrus CCMP1102]
MKFFYNAATTIVILLAVVTASVDASSATKSKPPPTAAAPAVTAAAATRSRSAANTNTSTSNSNKPDIGTTLIDLPMKVVLGVRRYINLNGILGSPTRPTNSCDGYTGYDKIMGHPVFQVTTAYGSAYMNMEKLRLDDVEVNNSNPDEKLNKKAVLAKGIDDASSVASEDSQYRTISLYYMDPNDAIAAHAEFKQMDGMKNSDVRICSISLAKALRSATNLGKGMLTGQPIDTHTGNVLSTKEGGSLRHKIMPPKKQLFYAARCVGKERIGFFSNKLDETTGLSTRDSQQEHAIASIIGNAALNYRNLQRKQTIRDRKLMKYQPKNLLEQQYSHMDGNLGLPVFYLEGMERHKNPLKRLLSGSCQKEIPLFFNYEDLEVAWQKTRPGGKDTNVYLPAELPPNSVEVFNLWDILSSIDKENSKVAMKKESLPIHERLLKSVIHPFQNRYNNVIGGTSSKKSSSFDSSDNETTNLLDSIVFIPSSDACSYKESITARGNSDARLRPMRDQMSQQRAGNGKLFGIQY